VILVVAPSPSVDVTYLLDRFERHAIHRPQEVVRVPGGKALNAARVAAALGAAVRVVAVLGGPSGAWIGSELGRRGIPVQPVATAQPTRSCVSIAHDGGLTEVYEPATPVSGTEWTALVAAVAAPARWVVISGSLPAGAPPGGVAELITAARTAGARVCIDTAGPPLATALAAGPDLVKVNAAEAGDLLALPADTAPATLARGLWERTGRTGAVVVTAGIHGAAAWTTANGPIYSPDGAPGPVRRGGRGITVGPPVARGAYPVGSGDAFLAGLVVELDRGADLGAALAAGTAAAAANAAVPGAGELSPSAR
jgi:1-phosphofructokinase family hexose kinase